MHLATKKGDFMAIFKGIMNMVSEISLTFFIIYVFWIIKNFLVIWKRKFLGEGSQSMVWNPFLLVLDEEVYGAAITKWIEAGLVVGLIYMILRVIKLV